MKNGFLRVIQTKNTIIKKDKEGYFGDAPGTIVAVLTGHGLKDPDRAIEVSEKPQCMEANVQKIIEKIGL